VDDFAVARLDGERFRAAPAAVRARVVVRLLMAIGGGDYPPRFERLSALTQAMGAGAAGRFKRTLAGCVVEGRENGFAFYREIGRTAPPASVLEPGATTVWDRRFRLRAALGEERRRAIGAGRGLAPLGALAALPAIERRGRVVAVPALGFFTNSAKGLDITICPILMQRLAAPPRFPEFSAGL